MTTPDYPPDPDRYFEAGKVVKPHGIKGEIKIFVYSGVPEDFNGFPKILLTDQRNSKVDEFEVALCRPQTKEAIIKLKGVDDRNMSDSLRGRTVWVDNEYLPPLEEDEFYWHDMVGLEVQTIAGLKLGRVKGLFEAGAADILVIKGAGREYLVPARNEFIVSIDYEAGVLVIDDVPGLLDINA